MKNKIYLLKSIEKDLPITYLLDIGLVYSQIASMLVEAKNEGLVIESDGEIVLTEFGKEILNNEENQSSNWIFPKDDSKIEKRDIFEIYIPKRDKIQSLQNSEKSLLLD